MEACARLGRARAANLRSPGRSKMPIPMVAASHISGNWGRRLPPVLMCASKTGSGTPAICCHWHDWGRVICSSGKRGAKPVTGGNSFSCADGRPPGCLASAASNSPARRSARSQSSARHSGRPVRVAPGGRIHAASARSAMALTSSMVRASASKRQASSSRPSGDSPGDGRPIVAMLTFCRETVGASLPGSTTLAARSDVSNAVVEVVVPGVPYRPQQARSNGEGRRCPGCRTKAHRSAWPRRDTRENRPLPFRQAAKRPSRGPTTVVRSLAAVHDGDERRRSGDELGCWT
jgi:hypothetical protein